MNTHALNAQTLELLKQFPNTEPMPALFLGHGSPMYAITDTEFGRAIGALAGKMPKPHAILCISAHWETRGTWLTAMTVHAVLLVGGERIVLNGSVTRMAA